MALFQSPRVCTMMRPLGFPTALLLAMNTRVPLGLLGDKAPGVPTQNWWPYSLLGKKKQCIGKAYPKST